MTAPDTDDHLQTIEYVRSILKQLHDMARAEKSDMLAYLIEMAHIEANDILRGARPLGSRIDKRHSAA